VVKLSNPVYEGHTAEENVPLEYKVIGKPNNPLYIIIFWSNPGHSSMQKLTWPLRMDYHPYFIPRIGEKKKKRLNSECTAQKELQSVFFFFFFLQTIEVSFIQQILKNLLHMMS
jgi:hypothetical protein